MEDLISKRLTTLGHPQRLALFRLLMRRYPDRVPAAELASALGVKASTLSAYLNALMQVDLVSQTREGTSLKYAVHLQTARETIEYLTFDCCRGRPEICAFDAAPNTRLVQDRPMNVLFVCTGNSARSIFAEALLSKIANEQFAAYSAGLHPRGEIHPMAVEVLTANGHDSASFTSKNLTQFQGDDAPPFDCVITVCDRAANEDCAAWSGSPICGHWGLPDPAQNLGSDQEQRRVFASAYECLHRRISEFSRLPFAALDRLALQKAVDEIGQMKIGEIL